MPKIPRRSIRCPACGKIQPDGGIRNTCVACGFQPVPSYDYEEDNSFHPHSLSRVKAQHREIARQVALRRMRGGISYSRLRSKETQK